MQAATVDYVDQYRDLTRTSVRSVARGAALSLLASLDRLSRRIDRGLARPRIHFLYLHHVFADEKPAFRRLLRHLSEVATPVDYSAAVDRLLADRIDAPYVALSFDDGLKSCLCAARILEEFGMRACFFLAPSIVGETVPEKIRRFCAERLFTPPVEFMTWDDVERLRAAGHEIGSHTVNHAMLGQLPPQQLADEIGRSRQLLQRRVGAVDHFAWPYGRFEHFQAAAARIVFDSGYRSCASAERGCHVAAPDDPRELCLRREHIAARWPLAHVDYFMARSARTATARDNAWPDGWHPSTAGGAGECASPS